MVQNILNDQGGHLHVDGWNLPFFKELIKKQNCFILWYLWKCIFLPSKYGSIPNIHIYIL